MKYPKKASAISDRPLTVLETIHHAKELRKRKSWLVNNYTALAAILALRDSQPSTLYLSARDDTPEDMPVQVFKEISKEIKQRSGKKCSITMRFADSFYKTCGTRTDRERLQLIMANESFRIFRFYGHLDKGTIEELLEKSPSIRSLGLAIQNSTDAETISNLNLDTVTQLEFINVSVSSDVAVEDLRPLNASFGEKNVYLTFPYLTDDWVDKVRPAVDALKQDIEISELQLPKCQVTAVGARRLASTLDKLGIWWLCIAPCGTWKPEQKEKDSIYEIYKKIGITVIWDGNWFYEVKNENKRAQGSRDSSPPTDAVIGQDN